MRRSGSLVLLAAVGAWALGQGWGSQGPGIDFRTYASGQYSRVSQPRVVQIVSEGQWQKYWMESTGNPARTAPDDVDFSREMLIAIHLGERRTGGYRVEVDKVRRPQIGVLQVHVVEYTPPPGAIVTQVITSPYTILRLPKTGERIDIVRRKEASTPEGGGNKKCDCACSCCRRGLCRD